MTDRPRPGRQRRAESSFLESAVYWLAAVSAYNAYRSLSRDLSASEQLFVFAQIAVGLILCAAVFLRGERRRNLIREERQAWADGAFADLLDPRSNADSAGAFADLIESRRGKRFSLYLRPGNVDTRLATKNPGSAAPGSLARRSIDVEELVASAVDGWCPMVAIGRFGSSRLVFSEFVGAPCVHVEGDWQSSVRQLLDSAEMVFLLPGYTSGVGWEIERILQSEALLAKTIWIMPPWQENRIGMLPFDPSRHWREVVEHLRGSTLALPPYSKAGALFIFDRGGRLVARRSLQPRRSSLIIQLLAAFFPPLASSSSPTRHIRRVIWDLHLGIKERNRSAA